MKNYLPEHKSDVEAVEYLKSLPLENVKADVPRLLECIQDLHWDIAHGVAEYLIPHIGEIQQQLIYIFKTEDEYGNTMLLGR